MRRTISLACGWALMSVSAVAWGAETPASAIIRSAQSGNWSDAATWEGGRRPQAGAATARDQAGNGESRPHVRVIHEIPARVASDD